MTGDRPTSPLFQAYLSLQANTKPVVTDKASLIIGRRRERIFKCVKVEFFFFGGVISQDRRSTQRQRGPSGSIPTRVVHLQSVRRQQTHGRTDGVETVSAWQPDPIATDGMGVFLWAGPKGKT